MTDSQPDQKLSGPGAGLSSTGKTADQFVPGEESAGTTYGDPGGTATAEEETTEASPGEDAAQDAEGDVEGR